MPEISRFFGIVIGMFHREHPPPHFHAVYGEHSITVDIETGEVHGSFPKRALRLVEEWRGRTIERLAIGRRQTSSRQSGTIGVDQ